jgi:hypothetical protein
VPSDQFSFWTQDITTTLWSREKIKLPAAGLHMVTRYVSEVAVLDRRGAPMPGQVLSVSAESLTEIEVDGAWYLVGPGFGAQVKTGPFGKITIAAAADSLVPPAVHVDAAGLQKGAVIQQAAAVHDYLAGTGTLPSQNGRFDAQALSAARAGGVPIVPGSGPDREARIEAVVNGTKDIFNLAAGKPPTSRSYLGTGPAPVIYGSAVGPDLAARAAGQHLGDLPVVYHEFATPADAAAHIQAIRDLDEYGGAWEDLARWVSDAWQGITNGVVHVFQVIVTETVKIFVWIGEKIVELAGLIVDTFEHVMRAIEAVVRQVVDTIAAVIDWLKALFGFGDILDTASVIEGIVRDGHRHLAHEGERLKGLAHGWFAGQKDRIQEALAALRDTYADDSRLGDFQNQVPSIPGTEPGGSPQSSWLLSHLTSVRAAAAIESPQDFLTLPAAIVTAFENLWAGASASWP